jgi:TolB-like protein
MTAGDEAMHIVLEPTQEEGRAALERTDSVPESLCRAHLERVANSVTFLQAKQLRRLLAWLGERSLASEAPPSERQIAAVVMGRKDFDPQSDSLVRKEMSRLREKLGRYYLSEGVRDEIRITAAGGYLLGFARRLESETGDGKSCWLVLPFRSNFEMAEWAAELFEETMFLLQENGRVELVAPTTALGYRGRTGDVRDFAAECHADLLVEGSVRQRNESFQSAVWMIDGRSGRARRAANFSAADISELANLSAAWLLTDTIP